MRAMGCLVLSEQNDFGGWWDLRLLGNFYFLFLGPLSPWSENIMQAVVGLLPI
jgi:hypothetical protein